MKSFLKEQYQYNHWANQQYIELLGKQNAMPEKAEKLLNHIIDAHQIWNRRLQQQSNTLTPWDMHTVENLWQLENGNYETSLYLIESSNLDGLIAYVNFKGQSFKNFVRDILFHVINHSTYHRGQIASAIKAVGIEPPVTDYIFYKR